MASIILGHPFSGALYGYFSDQMGGDASHTRIAQHHSYYRTLYGSSYKDYVDLALTLTLIYDDIYVVPADNFWPSPDRDWVPELGLRRFTEELGALYDSRYVDNIKRYAADEKISGFLRTKLIPEQAWGQIIASLVYETNLSRRLRSPILCGLGRRQIIQRMIEVDRPATHPSIGDQAVLLTEAYRNLTSLLLSPQDLKHLMQLKGDTGLREYSTSFRKMLESNAANTSAGTAIEDMAALLEHASDASILLESAKSIIDLTQWPVRIMASALGDPKGTATSNLAVAASRKAIGWLGGDHRWTELSARVRFALDSIQTKERSKQVLEFAKSLRNRDPNAPANPARFGGETE